MSLFLESPVVDAVANSNFKNLGEFPSLLFQETLEDNRIIGKQISENLVRGSSRLNGAFDSLTVRAVKDVADADMEEAQSLVKIGTGVDVTSQGFLLSNTLTQLSEALAGSQQFIKVAQTTPPVYNPVKK